MCFTVHIILINFDKHSRDLGRDTCLAPKGLRDRFVARSRKRLCTTVINELSLTCLWFVTVIIRFCFDYVIIQLKPTRHCSRHAKNRSVPPSTVLRKKHQRVHGLPQNLLEGPCAVLGPPAIVMATLSTVVTAVYVPQSSRTMWWR